jgi:hypothetical protein
MKLEFLGKFSTNKEISNFMKICPVGAELFRAENGWTDGQTNMMTLISLFAILVEHA